jgi:hypothetical protein
MVSTCRKNLVPAKKKSREYDPPHFFNTFLFTSFSFSKITVPHQKLVTESIASRPARYILQK